MEDSKTMAISDETNTAKHTSLTLAVAISLAAFLFAFVQTWIHSFGLQTLPKIATSFDHPQALFEMVAESVGASLLIPAIHVGVASFFKSKRNPSSRRRIFIGWGIFTIMLGIWTLWTKSKGF